MKLKEVLQTLKLSTVNKIELGYLNKPASHNLTVAVGSELLRVYYEDEVKLIDISNADTLFICIKYK